MRNQKKSKHFVCEYSLRSCYVPQSPLPVVEPVALDGVYSDDYVDAFMDALEESWRYYNDKGWPLPKHEVKVLFCTLPIDGRTFGDPLHIQLASRHEDSGGPCNRARVQATLAHELFHVIQAGLRGRCFNNDDPWAWFSEASATFMQVEVFPDSLEHLCCMYRWFDEPDKSLDESPPGPRPYGGVMFCEFLNGRFCNHGDLLQRIWLSAGGYASPFEAIESELQGRGIWTPFASPLQRDLFTDDFLVWNFFLGSLCSGNRRSRLYQLRFQHAFAGPVPWIDPGRKAHVSVGELGPLAARYHLIEVPEGATHGRILLTVRAIAGQTPPGKAVICAIDSDRAAMTAPPFPVPVYLTPQGATNCYQGSWQGNMSQWPQLRHLLVIVANTDWRDQPGGRRVIDGYDVDVEFA